jgi:hypothetical protein
MKQMLGVLRAIAVLSFTLSLGACGREMPTAPHTNTSSATGYALAAGAHSDRANASVFTAGGDITGAVSAFRTALGTLNPNTPGSVGSGRREINWDAVPALFTNTTDFPVDFFNQPAVGRARGLVSTTPGTGERVSDVNFADLDPEFANEFHFFSPVRTFAALGSVRLTETFFVPGSSTPAMSTGFGVVFADVDHRGSASIRLFGASGEDLGTYQAPAAPGGLSFVGVMFASARVARVEIRSGEAPVDAGISDISLRERGDDDGQGEDRDHRSAAVLGDRGRDGERRGHVRDLVIMDDFIYGEPVAVSGSPVATR